MENPFELILDRLNAIEKLIRTTIKNEKVENKEKTLEIFNISQAADFLSLSKSTIYGKTSTREIPHFKRGNRLYFKKSELEDWLTEQRIFTQAEIEKQADEYLSKKNKIKE